MNEIQMNIQTYPFYVLLDWCILRQGTFFIELTVMHYGIVWSVKEYGTCNST